MPWIFQFFVTLRCYSSVCFVVNIKKLVMQIIIFLPAGYFPSFTYNLILVYISRTNNNSAFRKSATYNVIIEYA